MSKLFKFLKPYAGAVLAIFAVLMVQAYCDLSLPTYTSDIVNVGIQQGGIDEKVPEVLTEEDLNHLLLFVPSDEKDTVTGAYEETKETYDYDGKVYQLKNTVKEDETKTEELADLLGKPMLLAAGFDSGSDMTKQMETQMKKQMKAQMETQMKGQMPEGMENMPNADAMQMPDIDSMSIYEIFQIMPAEQREAVASEIEKKLDSMPEMMVEQSAPLYMKQVYKRLGVNTDKIQTDYILSTGGKMLALAALGMFASILVGLLAAAWAQVWDVDFAEMYSVKSLHFPTENLISFQRHR